MVLHDEVHMNNDYPVRFSVEYGETAPEIA